MVEKLFRRIKMKNYFDIKDKVALVTDASSGLGWQIAQAFASQGCKMSLFARRAERLEENKKNLRRGIWLRSNVCSN